MHRLVEKITEVENHIDEYEFFKFHTLYVELLHKLKPIYGDQAPYRLIEYLEFKEDWKENDWDTSARWIEEDMAENPEKYTPKHLQHLPEESINTLREIHKPHSDNFSKKLDT
tara:strand:- start:569 stop:907 length:339 start_codon:yes stop_codon:yes gene_type:complete